LRAKSYAIERTEFFVDGCHYDLVNIESKTHGSVITTLLKMNYGGATSSKIKRNAQEICRYTNFMRGLFDLIH
jgi:hypothetical protein